MITASDIRPGAIVRVEGAFAKVVACDLHTGGGKSGSMVHLKLRNLANGHLNERRLAPTDKLEDVAVERVNLQYLYAEADSLCLMNPTTFEQLSINRASAGPAAIFLKEEMMLHCELFDGKLIAIDFPEDVELKVESTAEGLKGNAAFKEAVLENKMTLLVPQFIKEGDFVRVNVETQKYMDRVNLKEGQKEHPKPLKTKEKPAAPTAATPKPKPA